MLRNLKALVWLWLRQEIGNKDSIFFDKLDLHNCWKLDNHLEEKKQLIEKITINSAYLKYSQCCAKQEHELSWCKLVFFLEWDQKVFTNVQVPIYLCVELFTWP